MRFTRPETSPSALSRLTNDTAPSRQAESEQRRRRMLEAARACFGRLASPARRSAPSPSEAGVSNGLLYQFFRSKEHLFEVVLARDHRATGCARLCRGDARAERASRALEAMFRRSVEFCRAAIRCSPALLARATQRPPARAHPRGRARPRAAAPRPRRVASCAAASRPASSSPTSTWPAVADVICQLQVDYSRAPTGAIRGYPDSPAIIDAAVRFILDAVRA